MALQDITQPFIWRAGGAKMTPEQIAREREIAEALGVVDTSPVGHWLEGAARMANAAVGRIREGRANRAEQENATYNSDIIASLLGGGATSPSGASPASAVSAPMDPASARVAQAHSASASPGSFSGSQQEFVDMLMPAAMEASQRTGIDPRIIVAQAAQETGWGRSAPGNNFFGIKSHGKGGGQTFKTHEYVNGKRVNISDSFRQFGSPADSVAGYADFILENPRYRPLMAAQGLDAQLEALQASGYATDPNYSRSVGSIARGIQIPDAQQALESMAVGETMPMSAAAPSGTVEQALAQGSPVQTAQAGGIDPAIIQALSDPRASGMTREIAGMLMQQNMQQQQAEQERMRAEQQAQIEMQQRIQAAQAAGVDPRFIGDDEIWKQAAGAQFREQPTDIREYEYARGQGYQGSFSDFQLEQRRAGAMNVDARNMGTIPQVYRMVYDEAGNPVQIEPIPGGPADTSTTDAAAAENRQTSTSIITNAASRAREALRAPGLPATGTAGRMLSALPETNAAELRRQVEVLQSNAKVENLQAMRAASPTGGALGAVSDKENAMLAAKSGALDPDSPTFERDLDDYERTLLRIVHGPRVGDAIFEQSRETQSSKPISEMTDEELEALANGDR